VWLRGIAEQGARLDIDGVAVEIEGDGSFEHELSLKTGLNTFRVSVADPSGNVSHRERSLVYMPDRPAAVHFADAFSETGLLRTGERSFVARSEGVVLAGTTIPGAAIEVSSADGGEAVRSSSDASGAFQVSLTLDRNDEEFLLKVKAPSGFVTEEHFGIELDQESPSISVEPEPLPMTKESRLQLLGKIVGSSALWLGTEEVETKNERFEIVLELQPGENRIELLARDRVGNETRWQRMVLLDQQPPELLGQSVSRSRAVGAENVEISVQARDRSGLKRLSRFVLRVGGVTRSGTLVLDPLTGTYRGMLSLSKGLTGEVKLYSIELEDYAGNRKTYRF
jgi:hypothetical protein